MAGNSDIAATQTTHIETNEELIVLNEDDQTGFTTVARGGATKRRTDAEIRNATKTGRTEEDETVGSCDFWSFISLFLSVYFFPF